MTSSSVTDEDLEVRQVKRLLFHYGTTPEVGSEAEYQHYIAQLRQMHARMDRAGSFEPIAMAHAVMLRLQEYEASVLLRKAVEIWEDAEGSRA